MVRTHWTLDLMEAEVVCGLLREHDVAADVFDRAFVRQDWLRAIAFGGYRVMVPRAQAAVAAELMQRWRSGEFSLQPDATDVDEAELCPACGSLHIQADFRSWRLAFASIMLLGLPLPWSRHTFRCADCAHRWRIEPERFALLARRAEEGSAPTP